MKTTFGAALKTKTYKEQETLQERGKKRFQERVAEEKEAEREIKQFDLEKEKEAIDSDNRPTIQELIW